MVSYDNAGNRISEINDDESHNRTIETEAPSHFAAEDLACLAHFKTSL